MKCLGTEQLTDGLAAMIHRHSDLTIDQVIVKTYLRCILTVVGIIDMIEMSPINGTQTPSGRAHKMYRSHNLPNRTYPIAGMPYEWYLPRHGQ